MWKNILILAIFIFLTACGAGNSTNSSNTVAEKPVPVGALMTEYDKSKEATKAKYTGKTLTVRGYASVAPTMPTGADDAGILSLMEKGGDMTKMLVCQFTAADKAEFSRVKGGETVIVRGVFSDDMSTALKSCKLVDIEY